MASSLGKRRDRVLNIFTQHHLEPPDFRSCGLTLNPEWIPNGVTGPSQDLSEDEPNK